jgi:DNA topoisomerase-1
VEAEWMTAEDDRVCPKCSRLEGHVFTLDVIERLIPRHPNCRCVAIPRLGIEEQPDITSMDDAAELLGEDAEDIRANEYDESQHPRDANGRWTEGGAMIGVERKGEGKEGKWVPKEGGELPAHIAALKIPPAWKDVEVSVDALNKIMVRGVDAKDRQQQVYHPEFVKAQAELKFARNKEMLEKSAELDEQISKGMTSSVHEVREAAACLRLIKATGIRPGSESDTGAKRQAYGATTLQGRHVKVMEDGRVQLQFVGKKGVDLRIWVDDEKVAADLKVRKSKVGDREKIFNTTDGRVLDYSHELDGGMFKTKDFRTLKGTETALELIRKNPAPARNEKTYKTRVKDIAKAVSRVLGNTPTIALQSYINPFVFETIKPRTKS